MTRKITIYRAPDEVCLFVLRRAVRFGTVTRRDLLDAFTKIGTTKATQAMDAAVGHWPKALERTGKAVRVRAQPTIPAEASETQLAACLEQGLLEFRYTGLRQRELPVNRVQWTQVQPKTPGVLSKIVFALAHQKPVRICYVGLRQGESARWRLVYPAGLERMGDQWRLLAQDLEVAACPVKTFVLPRILEAEAAAVKLPKGCIRQSEVDKMEILPIRFNEQLSDDQRLAVCHELGIVDNKVELPSRSVFEYLRRFSDQPANEDAVWPPIFPAVE